MSSLLSKEAVSGAMLARGALTMPAAAQGPAEKRCRALRPKL